MRHWNSNLSFYYLLCQSSMLSVTKIHKFYFNLRPFFMEDSIVIVRTNYNPRWKLFDCKSQFSKWSIFQYKFSTNTKTYKQYHREQNKRHRRSLTIRTLIIAYCITHRSHMFIVEPPLSYNYAKITDFYWAFTIATQKQ